MQSQKEELLKFISEDLLYGASETELTSEDNLLSSGLLDSISIVKLVSFISDNYSVSVPVEDIIVDHFKNVDAIVDYLSSQP